MTFVVPGKAGRFEIRESVTTPNGPRSRTLASFRELDSATIEKARRKATKAIDTAELQRAARRAGAQVTQPPVDRAARELIAELGKGRQLDPALRHMLLGLLRQDPGAGVASSPKNEAELGVAEWMAASPLERGKALVDLLLLADALPHSGRKGKPLRFPRLDSTRQ